MIGKIREAGIPLCKEIMKEARDKLEETLVTKRDNNCFSLNQIFMRLGFDYPWFNNSRVR